MAKSTARYRAKLAAKWRKQRMRKRGLLKVTKAGGRMKPSGKLGRRSNRKLTAIK